MEEKERNLGLEVANSNSFISSPFPRGGSTHSIRSHMGTSTARLRRFAITPAKSSTVDCSAALHQFPLLVDLFLFGFFFLWQRHDGIL